MLEIRNRWVEVIGLQVAIGRWQGVEPVIGEHYCLGVFQFCKYPRFKDVVALQIVVFRGRYAGALRRRPPGKNADVRVLSVLREIVGKLELLVTSAKLARHLRAEVVG